MKLMYTLVSCVGGLVCVTLLWALVQRRWAATFGGADEDALVLRRGCGQCPKPCDGLERAATPCAVGEKHAPG